MVSTHSATASSPRRPRSSLSASHAILYPVTHALGVRGTKKDKRCQINQMWRENLEIHSLYPHFSARLPSNHRGHDLTGPILNTNKNADGYRQVCVGCPQAGCLPANRNGKRGGKTAVFCIRAGLPLHTLQSGMLGRLARARAELQPVSRAAARAARAAGATTNVTVSTLPPSSSPSISASSRATTPDASISTLSHDNAPDAPIVSHAIDTEHATAPSTPRRRSLTGFFGGYGGVHYSPEGYIINHSADHDDAVRFFDLARKKAPLGSESGTNTLSNASDSDASLQYPPSDDDMEDAVDLDHQLATYFRPPPPAIDMSDVEDIDTRTLDLTTPVYLIAWDDPFGVSALLGEGDGGLGSLFAPPHDAPDAPSTCKMLPSSYQHMAADIELLDNQSGCDLIEVRDHLTHPCTFANTGADTSELRQFLVEHNVATREMQHLTSAIMMTRIKLPLIEAISACELDESTARGIEIALKDGTFATSQNKDTEIEWKDARAR
ncbi:hypothetical protein B0H14DRAFT_2650775 [Mycena olivaceomarginata]|nr:hypothetical protein B0H14DRAFT_2650775 [Mycena olivaceomarginata]